MTDQELRLSTILDWLEQGKLTTDQAAARVETLHFPVADRPDTVWDRLMAPGQDPAVPESGSFFEVSAAYSAGRITAVQYAALARAAGKAMHADAQQRGTAGSGGDAGQGAPAGAGPGSPGSSAGAQ